MYVDIVDLKDFYAGALGKLVRRLMVRRLQRLWPKIDGMSLVGLGYTTPFLSPFRGQAERALAFMPARMGVANWPSRGPSASALVDETDLPLNDCSVERILLAHCLEMADASEQLLAEVRRVLVPGGRVAVAVPNRRGLWARFDTTPFGHGRPYSRPQLTRLLLAAGFTPCSWDEALWVPPFRNAMLIRSAAAFERMGTILKAMPAGILMVDAVKDELQPVPVDAKRARRLNILPVPAGAPAPARRIRATAWPS